MSPWRYAAIVAAVLGSSSVTRAEPTPVELRQTKDGWVLLRAGEPFRIKGVGGDAALELLARSGANTVRTWGADGAADLLDEAHRHGLAVVVGIWLGHARHGFDYRDVDAVASQYARAKEIILAHKDHPALLMWGVGNEMEGFAKGDDAAVWSAVNNLAALAKRLDPHHPTMTVIAELGGERVKAAHALLPEVDVLGINSYAGVRTLPERYRAAGGTKPYVVAETGPPGAWEVAKTSWGAPIEPTSTEKAAHYKRAYARIHRDTELALGSFMFLWGHKREVTPTWYGMFLASKERTAAVDIMARAWGGAAPKNRVPQIVEIEATTPVVVDPSQTVRARITVNDPERDPLDIEWRLEVEGEPSTGGDTQPDPGAIAGAVQRNGAPTVDVQMPDRPGAYRLYATARDGKGGAAVGNLPLFVRGDEDPVQGRITRLPQVIAGSGDATSPWVPSGYMGEHRDIRMSEEGCPAPKVGRGCLTVRYLRPDGWGGVVWQHPAEDWGDREGGFDLTGAKTLSFWARGSEGKEQVKFGYGLIGRDKPYFDTAREEIEVRLTKRWKRYTFDLEGQDLRRIKSPFFWVVGGQGAPVTFHLDDVRID